MTVPSTRSGAARKVRMPNGFGRSRKGGWVMSTTRTSPARKRASRAGSGAGCGACSSGAQSCPPEALLLRREAGHGEGMLHAGAGLDADDPDARAAQHLAGQLHQALLHTAAARRPRRPDPRVRLLVAPASWPSPAAPPAPGGCAAPVNAFQLGMSYLIEKGYKKIGYCTGRKLGPSSKKRFDAYKQQLQLIDEEVMEDRIFTECFTLEDGVRVAHQFKEMENPPEALIVAGDEVAIGIMTEVEKLGIEVPEDLAIIGFDNQPISQVLQLTTIDQNLKGIGKTAFEMFYRQVSDESSKQEKMEIPYKLVERSTV